MDRYQCVTANVDSATRMAVRYTECKAFLRLVVVFAYISRAGDARGGPMNATKPKVVVDHLSVSLGGNHILDDIELTVDEHEFLCIIGTSGGGKTTLLRSVGG